jgi:hypothetical protein
MAYFADRTIWSTALVMGSSFRIARPRMDAKFHRWASSRTDVHSSFVERPGSPATLDECRWECDVHVRRAAYALAVQNFQESLEVHGFDTVNDDRAVVRGLEEDGTCFI